MPRVAVRYTISASLLEKNRNCWVKERMSMANRAIHVAKSFVQCVPLILFSTSAVWLVPVQKASGTNLPPGFAEMQYASGLTNPTAMAFAPDPCPGSGTPIHRLFVCEQGGTVRVFRNGVLQPNAFLSVATDTRDERGLDGICFDPNFASNHYVYVYYTIHQSNPSLPTHNRLSRFTADPAHPDVALPGSETPIMEMDELAADSFVHNSGALHFGPDGKLYVSVGNNGFGVNSQSYDTVLGKILRINPVPENADGTNPESTFPSDNPFYTFTTQKNRAIYALGLRNPFTYDFQRGTGRMFIDDVGDFTWEKIVEGVKGGNYGYPNFEGPQVPPVSGLIEPLFAYHHFSNEGPPPYGCAITGGAFYNPSPRCNGDQPYGFPSSYVGQYFFLDLCAGWIYTMDPNQIDVASPYGFHKINLFASGIHGGNSGDAGATYLTVGPDANLYYISRTDGAVYQIRYPASLAPTIGRQPVNVLVGQGWPATFGVAASGVPPLSYQWQRGTTDIPGATSPLYVLSNPQVANDNGATFRCVVTNAYGTTTSQSATLTVIPQQPPAPTMTVVTPRPNHYYFAGDTISFSGSAIDPQDGQLPPSALTWAIVFEDHATSNPNHHTQPFFGPVRGITGGTVTIPTAGETDPDVWYRIFFAAVDSYGLSQVTFTDVVPAHAQLSASTNPAGLKVRVDGLPTNAPDNFWSVVNLTHNIGVDTPQVLNGLTYDFYSWSDNGARFHDIATPASNTNYIANFWRRPGFGSITANPNPVRVTNGTSGVTELFWSSGQTTSVEVHRDSPSGLLVARTGPGTFSQATGNWVQEGTRLFLQDVSNGQPLTSAFTLDSVTLHVTSSPTGSITADPNPLITDWRGSGVTKLSWTSYQTTSVEIHVNAPNGSLFGSSGPGSFSETTEPWASPGMTFYLQNTSNGLPLTSANTLATVTMIGGTISLNPNPIHDSSGVGVTTVSWNSYGTSAVQVRVGSPAGAAFTGIWGAGPGSETTGRWVVNGLKFYLQDVSDGKPLTSANTLAVVTAVVVP
jgi:glucose/arabinose dehydrogenase